MPGAEGLNMDELKPPNLNEFPEPISITEQEEMSAFEARALERIRKAIWVPNETRPSFEDTSQYDKDNDRFIRYAKQYVVGANAVETAETGEYELTVDDLYVVWFVKVLQNWKCLISTSIPGDGLYFEVTHNGDKEETYVDIYKKSSNHVFSHHDH